MSVTTTYSVTGMTGGQCAEAVTTELTGLPGVRDVRVDVQSGAVEVTSDAPLPIDEVRTALDEAGYALAGLHA